MTRTPRDLRAAMLAREGTTDGEMLWPLPWRVRKAIWVPVGREQMVIGELGNPQGWNYTIMRDRDSSWDLEDILFLG